jgi:flagellar hook-basal body complex protein FliE
MTAIPPIAPISAPVATTGLASPTPVIGVAPAGGASFMDMIGNAIEGLNTQMVTADNMAMRLAAGEDIDLHQVMVALETASIGLQSAMQVRNRAIEAYREVMAMPL